MLLVGFGGPTQPAEIVPFLEGFWQGRAVPPQRREEFVRRYEAIGGRSPYNELVMNQAAALGQELERAAVDIPVFVGMRQWAPYVFDAMGEMAARGVQRAAAIILAPHRSEASYDRYVAAVDEARRRLGPQAPEVDYLGPWHNHPLFITAVVEQSAQAIARLDAAERDRAQLIFTAHSIPVQMASQGPYVQQLNESARLVAQGLGRGSWTLAFQSRSGNPNERWLEPDISDALRQLAGRPAVVIPIGFICDHLEVLYDLDIDAARAATEAGVTMVRARTVGDHPAFIGMMAEMVRRALGQ